MTAPWLRRVLRDLEGAIVLLVDAQLGRAPCGGQTLTAQRWEAVVRADRQIEAASTAFERQAATLSPNARKRAAALFGAAFAMRERVCDSALRGGSGLDQRLAAAIRRCETVQN